MGQPLAEKPRQDLPKPFRITIYPFLSFSEIEIAVSPIRRDLGGSDYVFEFLLGKTGTIAHPVRGLEFSQDKGFPRVKEQGYSQLN